MKRSIPLRLLSFLLTAAVLFTMCTVAASAAGNNSGKYLKDVYIAYGEDKAKAEDWLKNNGWEPIDDLNEGKTAGVKTNAVAMLGIRRTSDPSEAITDMATMNMNGGYSFEDYESLVNEKKANITEFINTFIPALKEYRDNYNEKGSAGGQKRAQMAHDMLNKFYDGDPNGEYAVNDTGKPLGDLLLNKTSTELGADADKALLSGDKANTADLQQIILESSGPAMLIVEKSLALATDTAEDSWIDRLDGLTGQDLVDRIEEFAPEAEGQDLAPSAAMNLLASHFEDYAKTLAKDWITVHEDILWYEQYCDDNDLWQDKDSGEIDGEKATQHFANLKETDSDRYDTEFQRCRRVYLYYFKLKDVSYSGDWGDTLYEFFRPEDEEDDFSEQIDYFAPLAASLSDGQRAALEFINLSTLLQIGADSDSVTEADFPAADDMFKDKNGNKLESISIYSGINRAIFRKGVALTSKALQQKNMGRDPYDKIWDEDGLISILSYCTMAVSSIAVVVGAVMIAKTNKEISSLMELANAADVWDYEEGTPVKVFGEIDRMEARDALAEVLPTNTAGKWLVGIGVALTVIAALVKAEQLIQYYNRTFSQIPIMIVDEEDIVSYYTDDKGNRKKKIDFLQFAYYEVVKCNRQKIGIHTSAQSGVSDYQSWGCGDAADINADVSKEWLAMYINRSSAKGNPILADLLKLQKGSSDTPVGYDGKLHMFGYENAVTIDNTEYCFSNDKNGMYLFWKSDANALSAAASTFNAGYLALAAIGGLALGIVGTTAVMLPKLKKKEEEAA